VATSPGDGDDRGRASRTARSEWGMGLARPATQGARARPWARMCNRYAVGGGGTRWAVGWTPVWCVRRVGDGFGDSGCRGGWVSDGGRGLADGFGTPGREVGDWFGMLDGEADDRFGTSGDLRGWEARAAARPFASPPAGGGRVKRRRPHVARRCPACTCANSVRDVQ